MGRRQGLTALPGSSPAPTTLLAARELRGSVPAGAEGRQAPHLELRERLVALSVVIAVHLGVLGWIADQSQQEETDLAMPPMEGVLVAVESPGPPAGPAAGPEAGLPNAEPFGGPLPEPLAELRPEPEPAREPEPEPELEPVLEPAPEPGPEPAPEPSPILPQTPRSPPKPVVRSVTQPQPAKGLSEPKTTTVAGTPRSAAQSEPGRAGAEGAGASGGGEPGPVTPPRADAAHLHNPEPGYPSLSRRLREEGKVLLDVHILADGSVGELRLRRSSGYPRLDEAARSAVKRWRYLPARRGGKAIDYWYVQPVQFSLR